jgi:two-component system KDP operon response regulator KdpE
MMKLNKKTLEITLESNDYKVWLAETGKEGDTHSYKPSSELILLDIGLPIRKRTRNPQKLRTWYNKAIILSVQDAKKIL